MRWLPASVWLACLMPAVGRLAVVAPISGATCRGHVRFTEQGLIVVNADQDLWRQVAATNLAWAVFETPSVPPAVETASDPLPAPWQEADIGPVSRRGSTGHAGGSFTVRSAGAGIGGSTDSFHFVYVPASTNWEITAQVTGVHQTHPAAQAAVMARAHLGPSAPCVLVGLTPARGGFFQWREADGALAESRPLPGLRTPCWLKLCRQGPEVVAYHSRGAGPWTPAGKVRVPMPDSALAGLATTSGREGVLNWTRFSRVRTGTHLVNLEFPPRAELVSGSVVIGWPVSVENDTLELRWGPDHVKVPRRAVARLVFQWASPERPGRGRPERSGVWLANGEFLEADFRAVEAGRLRVSSVLYGGQSFDARHEVVMVVLQGSAPRPARVEVRTVNGSLWRAAAMRFGDNEVILQEPALGAVRVPIHELARITRP